MTADPALGFWLRAVEAEGALHEQTLGATVLLLPPPLQRAYGLPEEVTVTADPEVAREEGALLLAPGHPVLDRATERVLAAGDVGPVPLAWPSGPPPSAEAFLPRLRAQVPVHHGRIDAAPELPVVGCSPVLRVGTLTTYAVTFDERFQEQQEVWIDSVSSLPLPPAMSAALARAEVSPVRAHRVLPADRALAARAAQDLLDERAGERLAALASQSGGAKNAELTRVRDYYTAALDALARRRDAAEPDRQALLDARAAATRAERDRRLAEVEEKFRGSVTTRWYRLHEILVPTVRFPVIVRRGLREYPFELRWLLTLQDVAPVRCPHCTSPAPLVAGKQRLGCLRCLASVPVPRAFAPARVPAPAHVPVEAPDAAPELPAPGAPVAAGGPVPPPRPPADRSRVLAPAQTFDPQRCSADGNRLGLRFWKEVAADDRRLSRLVVPGSPADLALRLWGPRGPALVVGTPPGSALTDVEVGTAPDPEALLQVTAGTLRSGWRYYPYTLRWEGGTGRPGTLRVAEVVPGRTGSNARLPGSGALPWWRSSRAVQALPAPRIALDAVAAALWRVELPLRGPHLMLRCLAAWERARADVVRPGPSVAAALARAVAACAGIQVSIELVARQYTADAVHVRTTGGELRRLLALSAATGW